MSTKHILGPIVCHKSFDGDKATGYSIFRDGTGQRIAILKPYGSEATMEELEAYGEQIVRACNNHDRLVKALRDTVSVIQGWEQCQPQHIADVADSARAALAEAEVKP